MDKKEDISPPQISESNTRGKVFRAFLNRLKPSKGSTSEIKQSQPTPERRSQTFDELMQLALQYDELNRQQGEFNKSGRLEEAKGLSSRMSDILVELGSDPRNVETVVSEIDEQVAEDFVKTHRDRGDKGTPKEIVSSALQTEFARPSGVGNPLKNAGFIGFHIKDLLTSEHRQRTQPNNPKRPASPSRPVVTQSK